ncbi:hypothetical protein O6P43_006061 [Quillaja saponaria]|uniref:Uncharacterized protein n=1 Tax=Quillaja saponaria TaxID=32244 RepID=A0AAD7VHW3_QUISA|nr:hypothetical protein O6P43_006061 [Quillaja saponaria]
MVIYELWLMLVSSGCVVCSLSSWDSPLFVDIFLVARLQHITWTSSLPADGVWQVYGINGAELLGYVVLVVI